MAGVNKVILVGNLGSDPEIRYTPNGATIANFKLATNETRTNKDGKKETSTEWHFIVAFGKLAETCAQYIKQGSLIYLEGKIQTRSWDDKDGNKKYKTEIIANSVQFLDRREGKEEQGQAQPDIDEIPF